MIKYEEITEKKSKEFGLVIGGLLFFVSLFLHFTFDSNVNLFILIGLVLLFFGVVFPISLRPVTFIWVNFSFILNKLTSPIVLFLVYFFLFFPYSLFLKLFKVNFLPLGKSVKWVKVEPEKININYFKRQF